MAKTQVQGLDQLIKRFQTMPQKLEKNVVKKALQAGAKVYIESIKQQIDSLPMSSSGKRRLKRALIVKPIRSKRMAKGAVSFGVKIRVPRNRDERESTERPWYWFLFEDGTTDRYRKTYRAPDGSKKRLKKPAFTGKIAPQHFVKRATEAAAATAKAAIEEAARNELAKAGTI